MMDKIKELELQIRIMANTIDTQEKIIKELKREKNLYKPSDADIIPFGMYLTGYDKKTVEQMYRDWY